MGLQAWAQQRFQPSELVRLEFPTLAKSIPVSQSMGIRSLHICGEESRSWFLYMAAVAQLRSVEKIAQTHVQVKGENESLETWNLLPAELGCHRLIEVPGSTYLINAERSRNE